jgi:hypothetical protein
VSTSKHQRSGSIPTPDETFSKHRNLQGFLEQEEIKEEAEFSSSRRDSEAPPAIPQWQRQLQSSKALGGVLSELVNPFAFLESNSASKKSSGTPNFKRKRKSNVFCFSLIKDARRKDSVDYNEPSRYLYEFFTHKKFRKFRDRYLR